MNKYCQSDAFIRRNDILSIVLRYCQIMAGRATYQFPIKEGVKMRLRIGNHVTASPLNTKVDLTNLFR